MPKYFLDHHSNTSIEIDDEGIDLPDVDAARRLALEALGQSVLDGAPRSLMGRLAIEVRDPHGPILRASATVVLEEL
ncbi:DUF6894 family protein [Bradyrhizobium japonicum]|uniref:DUF6894 family protein n=1 Tax=Bradyrhizobium japonicum TaxID=375 RepID=UPI000576E12B|nr:hypothetical protein [Bradyrhizobium japonicum]